jgi:competence protein ComEA
MLRFSRLAMGVLALAIAGPVMAQPATTMPNTSSPPSTTVPAAPRSPTSETHGTAVAPKADMVDINSASAAELKMLPGVSDTEAAKIIQGRPYAEKSQLVSKKVLTETAYDKIKDRVVAKGSKS